MTTTTKSPALKAPATKTATVCKLLGRLRGATVPEMMKATEWQSHSVRAFLTGLRKKGRVLVREERSSGVHAYRLIVGGNVDMEAGNAQP